MPKTDQRTIEVFKSNVARLVSDWIRHGGTVKTLAADIFCLGLHDLMTGRPTYGTIADDQRAYRWLRKAIARGYPEKKPGQKNRPELERLHAFFGLRWGDLWRPECQTAVERLTTLLPRLSLDAVDAVHRQIDRWEEVGSVAQPTAERILAKLERERPDLYAKAKAETNWSWPGLMRRIVDLLMQGNSEDAVYDWLVRWLER